MPSRLAETRRRFHSWISPAQRRGVRILAWVSLISLAGVSLTGIWQFFFHEDDSGWYGYQRGSGARLGSAPSDGVAEWHGIFGAAVAVTALLGSAWFAYRILYDVPWHGVVAILIAVVGLVRGSVMRLNIVKLEGREYDEAGDGYLQIFGSDLEFVVTSRFELGATAIRLWTIAHVLTVPILLAAIWLGLPRADDTET